MGIMNLAEIMDRSIDIVKKYIKTFVLFTLSYGIVSSVIGIVLMLVITVPTVFIVEASGEFVLPAVLFSILGLAVITLFLALNIGVIKIGAQDFLGESVYTSDAFKVTFKGIPKTFGLLIACMVLYLPVIAVFGTAGYYIYLGFSTSEIMLAIFGAREITLIIISAAVAVGFIIVTLIYFSLISFSLPAAIIEKRSVIRALRRSFWLVRGNLWKILGYNLLFGTTITVVQYSIESFFGLIIGVIFLVLNLLNIEQDFTTVATLVYSNLRIPISLLFWLIVSPISMTMGTLLYFNQRFKKEGFDLMLKLRAIEKIESGKQVGGHADSNDSI
jgi:hypothetical protein